MRSTRRARPAPGVDLQAEIRCLFWGPILALKSSSSGFSFTDCFEFCFVSRKQKSEACYSGFKALLDQLAVLMK